MAHSVKTIIWEAAAAYKAHVDGYVSYLRCTVVANWQLADRFWPSETYSYIDLYNYSSSQISEKRIRPVW